MSDAPLEFYFDFNSPYGYVGAHLIDNIAERYDPKTHSHPILLGMAFKQTGAKPLTEIPIKQCPICTNPVHFYKEVPGFPGPAPGKPDIWKDDDES